MKLTRNVDKIKFTYDGPGIGLDVKGMWSYGNDFARIAVLVYIFSCLDVME